MSDDIILEHLKAIRHQMDGDGARLNRIELRLGATEQHLGLMVASGAGDRDAAPSGAHPAFEDDSYRVS